MGRQKGSGPASRGRGIEDGTRGRSRGGAEAGSLSTYQTTWEEGEGIVLCSEALKGGEAADGGGELDQPVVVHGEVDERAQLPIDRAARRTY